MRWAVLWVVLIGVVLAPFLLFERQFDALSAWLAAGHLSAAVTGAAIVALLGLDVFLPVPSSIVSTGAGALLGFWLGAAVVWAGMTIGCAIGYACGSRTAALARRLVGEDGLARAGAIMDRYGAWALVICRPVPVLAEASTVFAGLVRRPLGPFLGLTTLSNLGIAVAYTAVGAYSMEAQSFVLTFAGALALPAVAMGAARLWLKPGAGRG
jgi:uncharacterized membrane protein YdjX (TVP38/TMEM64 family)